AVEQVGAQTAWGRIVQAVEAAESSRAPVERLADRVAGWLVYAALAGATLAWLLTGDLRATISVVLVAGACGVAAGTPLALLGAIGRCARAGAVVKGGPPMEALGEVDTVVFDKTGTLTLGQPVVVALQPAPGVEPTRLLQASATAERDSEHPLARAVLAHAAQAGIAPGAPEGFAYGPGRGVRCRWQGRELAVGNHLHASAGTAAQAAPGRTVLYVAQDGQPLGTLHIEDAVRPDTRAALGRLEAQGLRLVLLSGDTDANAKALAARLGIPEAAGGLLPHDKVAAIERLKADGRRVAMVGDGINDAPALARSHVGIAMGGGTDLAAETAGVVLLGSRLEPVVEALEAGRRCRRIVWQNLVGTLLVDGAGMVLAGLGWLPPIAAGLVHVGSELAFILNATRMLPPRRRGAGG
ncbi:MAG: heavy metal translocating P-type ATPase, partial [Planctomycetia bacterium]